MADLASVEAAFLRAHQAGDTKAAEVLAGEVRRLRAGSFEDAGAIPSDQTLKAPVATPDSPSIAKRVRDMVGPTVEGLGAVGGGVLGTALAPGLGTVGGAGLGYGIAKGGLRVVDELAGWKPPVTAGAALTRAASDVLEGASMEAGGQIIARNAIPYAAKAYGGAHDLITGMRTKVKAGEIARGAIGPDISAVRNALQQAPEGLTAAQATSHINSPTWQALAQNAGTHDPRFFGAGPLTPTQEAMSFNQLAGLAGGSNQTAAMSAREADKQLVRDWYKPALAVELGAANTAGRMLPKLQGEANRMSDAAASKVEDVRRFTAAGGRAAGRAHTTVIENGKPVAAVTAVPGYPRQPGRYTYMGELEGKAGQVAKQAADDSLPLGEAARFAQWQADSLAAGGLRPLTPDSVQAGLKKTLANPDFAGNADIEHVALSVIGRVKDWTLPNGTISANAFDSIRKDAVNTAVTKLGQGLDPAATKALAAKVSAKVSPMIVDAIEQAGGTGYGRILKEFAKQRQVIDQKELASTALDALKTSPKSFVSLVEGDAPKTVNSIFGRGDKGYDIAAQMSPANMNVLRSISDVTKRGIQASEQATTGQTAFKEVMKNHTTTFQLPNLLDPKIALTNRAIRYLQSKFSASAMHSLTDGMRSGKSAVEMLDVLPAKDRIELLKAMRKPELWMVPGGSAAAGNMLFGDSP